MFCDNCKHYEHANGMWWCGKGQTINPLNTSENCSYFEPCPIFTKTTTSELSQQCLENVDPDVREEVRLSMNTLDCVVLASRLAESILMEWPREEQIELAKDVACRTHEIIVKENERE